MNFRLRSLELPSRNKYRMRSLHELLDKQPIPVPQQSLINNFLQKYSSESSRVKQLEPHKRTFSNHEGMRKTYAHKSEVKSNILVSLRKTWHPIVQSQQLKLRTAGASHYRHQSLELNPSKRPIYKKKEEIKVPSVYRQKQKQRVTIPKQDTEESNFTPQCKKSSHNFLRKGSSINRQVVVNILKLKLGKNSQKFDSQHENEQILKMIRLYKGYGQDPDLIPKLEKIKKRSSIRRDSPQNPFQNKNLLERSLIGWGQSQQQGQYHPLNNETIKDI